MKMKKLISLILTLLMCVSVFAVFGAVDVSAAENGYDRGYKETMAGTGKVVSEGLDISEHQSGMNIQKIKDAGFDYVILRAGVKLNAGSNRKDYNFEEFYTAARKAGLDIGTYYYSQAKSVAEAKEEAKCFLEYIKGKTFEYPVYLDFESSSVRDYLGSSASKATEICYAFMDVMRDAGYLVGLYGYASWFDPGYGGWMASALDDNIGKKYEFWMANYFNNMLPENDRTKNYKNKYGMYQYTSSKTISGWSGKLDHNVCYKDYPSIVKKYGFNGYDSEASSVIKYDTAKSVLKMTTTLKEGSTNKKQITYLQKALDVLGYYTKTPNGEYDTTTVNAVRKYQNSQGLTVDGEAGPSTLTEIVNDIMFIEGALKYLGYYGSTPNADADELLVAAIEAFQKAEKIRVNGIVNEATLTRLKEKVSLKAEGKKDTSTEKPTVATLPPETEAPVTQAPATDVPTDLPTETEIEIGTQVTETLVPETEPIVTEPVVTEPVVTEPIATEPIVTEPVVTEPIATDPMTYPATGPVTTPGTEPITQAPIVTEPIVTDPVVTEPIITEPIITEPVVTEPIITEPIVTEPITQAPIVTEPITQAPIVTEPITQAPIVTEPITQAPATESATLPVILPMTLPTTEPVTMPSTGIVTTPSTETATQQGTQADAEVPTIGCGATISAGVVTIALVSGAAVLLKKKKED